jgi:transcriptional regulator with XRE-family HTH domain
MQLERPGTLPLAELIAHRRQAMDLSLNAVGRLMDKAAQAEGTYSLAGRQAVHGYERGRIPRRDSLRWLASALGLPAEEVLAAARRQAADRVMARAADVLSGSMATGLAGSALIGLGEPADHEREALELAQRIEASDIGSVTLEGLELGIDNLCRSYTTLRPEELLGPVRRYRAAVDRLLDARATLVQRRQLMVLGGWVSLLAACVHVDLGQREAAYASRLTAQRIGVQTESGELAAWAFEIGAWQALLDGHYDEAVSLCQAGQRLVGTGTSAYVQLTAQEARAWARQKQERETRAALDRSGAAFAQMPPAGQSDHHFTFDARKQVGYSATTFAWLGASDDAEQFARQAIRCYEDEAKQGRSLRRLATARIDLAVVVADQDRPQEACHLGEQALTSGRLVPSNIWRVAELDRVLQSRYGSVPDVRDFHEHYLDVHATL